MQQIQHATPELLASNPSWGVLQLDAESAFQNVKRSRFLRRLRTKVPPLYPWARRCYARAQPRYLRKEDGSFHVFWQTDGVGQGDPLGPAEHNFGLDELLHDLLQPLVDAAILYYLDDGTIVGPVEELAKVVVEFTREGGQLNFYDFTGMRLNIEKCSVWTLRSAFPAGDLPLHFSGDPEQQRMMAAQERDRLRSIFPAASHAMRGLREPAQKEPERSKDAHLSQGVKLLGSPVVGTDEFVDAELSETIAKARVYVETAQRILLGDGEHHHVAEYLALMRVTLPGRFTHHCGAVGSRLLPGKAIEFDNLQRWAYESVVGQLDETHIDAVTLLHSPTLWGGRGHVSAHRVCSAILVGSWAMTHASNRSRLGPIRRAPVLMDDSADAARAADSLLNVTTSELRQARPELEEWCEGLDLIE